MVFCYSANYDFDLKKRLQGLVLPHWAGGETVYWCEDLCKEKLIVRLTSLNLLAFLSSSISHQDLMMNWKSVNPSPIYIMLVTDWRPTNQDIQNLVWDQPLRRRNTPSPLRKCVWSIWVDSMLKHVSRDVCGQNKNLGNKGLLCSAAGKIIETYFGRLWK